MAREEEEDEDGAEGDRGDAGRVGPVVALEEELWAAETICGAYCGYCSAVPTAPANDLVSWLWTASLTWPASAEEAILSLNADA